MFTEGKLMRSLQIGLLSGTALFVAATGAHADEGPLLLQRPAVSRTHIAFVYAGDLWLVGRDGGDATRLTSGVGLETHPVFSPDGTQIAFGGEYEGNLDVYVVPRAGGVPRRLTHHPAPDLPVGWTPDGKAVLFRSPRDNHAPRVARLYTVPVSGGMPTPLPLPMAVEASYSPDGQRLAYVPFSNRPAFPGFQVAWKKYRGGTASPIWIADLADSSIIKVPRDGSNDFNPMWVGGKVYFLSDRDGPTSLLAYDVAAETVKNLLPNREGPDIKSASATSDAIVYDQFGELHLYDIGSNQTKKLEIHVHGDIPGLRPRFEKVVKKISKAGLSPTGARALFEARGEIVTVPVEKGDVRDITNTPGVAERDPSWSPDGKWIAYFSDESGEYELHLRPQSGVGEVKKLTLGDAPSFYYAPVWSPDAKKIAFSDKRLNYWYIDLDSGKSTKVDTSTYADFDGGGPMDWSPDSKWIAYSKQLKNYLYAVFLYSVQKQNRVQVSDGMSDARFHAFDKDGKHLYFLASTDLGPAMGSGMSTFNRSVTRAAYVVVLNKDDSSPLSPQSDEEKPDATAKDREKDKNKEEKKETPATHVDAENIDQRTLALPVPARNYVGLLPGKAGTLLLLEGPTVLTYDDNPIEEPPPPPVSVHRFEFEKRKSEKLVEGVSSVAVSYNGEKVLYRKGDDWFVVKTDGSTKAGEGKLNLDALEVRVDPPAEWRQIYHEVWRIERDFLYDPNYHGYNVRAAEKEFAKYLPGLGSRHDLNYLLDEMLGRICLGHVFVYGGGVPEVKKVKTGLLGADYTTENGRHRFARVYRGENWNPKLRAPLTQPGAGVKQGEYLLAVNGRDIPGAEEVYRFFEGTAGKQVVLRVGPNPDGKGARDVTVQPVPSEFQLRHLAWVDDNRRKVDDMTGGKVAYIYLPDTFVEGFARFNRYFYGQAGKEGAVIDERFNSGGFLADHVIDRLGQVPRNYMSTREGEDQVFPTGSIPGPKVMIVNEMAGSGGDYMPYTFRQAGLGRLIGKRTWGGLVGIGGYPTLLDGGGVTAPHWAIWFPNGRWEVENRGVGPDVEVEFDPKAARAGRDPQLEKAVELVMEELKKNPPRKPQRPAYPNYYKGLAEPAEGK
jgi:tricorn protease